MGIANGTSRLRGEASWGCRRRPRSPHRTGKSASSKAFQQMPAAEFGIHLRSPSGDGSIRRIHPLPHDGFDRSRRSRTSRACRRTSKPPGTRDLPTTVSGNTLREKCAGFVDQSRNRTFWFLASTNDAPNPRLLFDHTGAILQSLQDVRAGAG